MLLILALVSSAFAVSSALRLRGEESSGRLEATLATGLSRTRWLLESLLVSALGSLLLLVAAGLGLGLSYGVAAHDAVQPLRLAGLALVYAPAVLVLAAVAAVLVGWLPRGVSLAWVVVALCFVLGWLGSLLHPPQWLADLSPFEHTPAVPVDPLSWAPLVVLLVVVGGLVAAAVAGLRRRDLPI
jgi:ABC-2 type transport system permease protein